MKDELEFEQNGNLCLGRYEGESIYIGENIRITVSRINSRHKQVILNVSAPKDIRVLRGELFLTEQEGS